MHASNLLKAVLKPGLHTKESKPRGPRASSPDSGLSLTVTKKSGPAPKPAVKMSCLCAPTSHAGSFRCRLHRGNAQSWGGRPVPAGSTTPKSPSASPTPSPKGPSSTPSQNGENGNSKRVVPQLPRQPTTMSFLPAQRSSDMPRPSRLSRVSAASDVDPPAARASAPVPSPASKAVNPSSTYLKFSSRAGSCGANGAVIDGGMSFVKKLQTGGKEVMQEVFGSGTTMSRAALSL